MTTENFLPLSGTATYVWLIPALPFLAFLIVSFITRCWGKVSATVSIAGLLASLGVALGIFGERLANPQAPPMQDAIPWITFNSNMPLGQIELGLLVDNLSSFMLVMVCFVGLCIQIYSYAYMSAELPHFPTQGSASMSRFFGWLSLFMFSMLGLALANNLLRTYIFRELVGLCSYLLIGFWYFKTSAAHASKKAFIVTRFGDLGLLMGILLLGVTLQHFDFISLSSTLSAGIPKDVDVAVLTMAGILIFCGAVGKSAQFPLHIWLPDAMEGPTPVSALIHAATMVAAGIYLVARIFPVFHPAGVPTSAALVVAFIGGITALLAATIAVVQNDIKKVLAYSTISQLGFMMTALGVGAYTAGTFHLFTHAFFKALLFLGSGAVIVACHSNDMWRMGGLRKALPYTWFAFLMGCLALAGIPPFSGFWSKDEILSSLSQQSGTPWGMCLYIMLSLATFLTAFYVTRLYFITFEGKFRGANEAPADLQGPVPSPDLPAPAVTSLALDFQPQWTEEKAWQEQQSRQAAKQELLPPACLGAHMEHEAHDVQPHEVSPLMWGPLLVLSLFAIGLGFVGMPEQISGLPNFFASHIHPTTPVHEHEFNLTPMIVSVVISLLGIIVAYAMYHSDASAGERKLRSLLGKVGTAMQQKWYMDHLWAFLLSNTVYLCARIAESIDNRIFDGFVNRLARFADYIGEKLREEHTGYVQNYLFIIIISILVLVFAIGYIEPHFATSPKYWAEHLWPR